jgi:hypothetical protein
MIRQVDAEAATREQGDPQAQIDAVLAELAAENGDER